MDANDDTSVAPTQPSWPTSGEGAAAGGLRLGACLRTTPRVVWALAALFGTVMAAYTVLVPTYHGPDESKHVDMLFAVVEPGGWPTERERFMNEQVVESSRAAGYEPGRRARTADEAVPRGRRPTFDELAPDAPSAVTSQMWQHPPLGYVVTAVTLGFVTAVVPTAGGWAHDQVVGLARLLDALVLVPLPLLAFWAARRLGGRRAATAATVLAVAVPGVAHIGATVTNDGLLITLIGLATVGLVHVATGDLSLRTALLVGLTAGLALLTKGFALFLPAWITAAYALAVWRGGQVRRAATAGALAMGVGSAVGGWWWLRNLLDLGVVQPQGFSPTPAATGFVPDVSQWFATLVDVTPRTFWGYFGWTEAPLPWAAVGVAATVVTAGVTLAMVRRPAAARWRRGDVGLALGGLAGTGAIMAYGSWSLYAITGRVGAMHGRYVMPGLVGLMTAAALGLTAALPPRLRRALPVALLAGAGGLHLLAAAVLLHRYWMPRGDSYADGIAAMLSWSPWSPAVASTAAVLAVGTFSWAAAELALAARRPRRHASADLANSDSNATRLTAMPATAPPARSAARRRRRRARRPLRRTDG